MLVRVARECNALLKLSAAFVLSLWTLLLEEALPQQAHLALTASSGHSAMLPTIISRVTRPVCFHSFCAGGGGPKRIAFSLLFLLSLLLSLSLHLSRKNVVNVVIGPGSLANNHRRSVQAHVGSCDNVDIVVHMRIQFERSRLRSCAINTNNWRR